MRNLKLTIQYFGTNYLGWQVQPIGPTVQGVLQEALKEILCRDVTVFSSSRTDSGVHAFAQIAHFKTDHSIDPATLQRALNHKLPPDIGVLSVEEAPMDFHAQRSAVSKSYAYLLLHSRFRVPFLFPYSWRLYGDLDLEAMRRCLDMLVGEHDFNAFKAADSTAKTSVRRLLAVRLRRVSLAEAARALSATHDLESLIFDERAEAGASEPALVTVGFRGEGFLKHMIRNIMGTLVEAGLGRISVERFREIFASCDRTQAGRTAPPQGLFLLKVSYPK